MTGPRPLQQLLGVVQSNDEWKQNQERLRLENESLKVAQANADVNKRSMQGQLLQSFMSMAPNADPADRAHLAGLIGQAAGVDPASLMGAVGNRPMSAATIGDMTARAQYEATKGFMPKLEAAINEIPDENVKSIARGYLSKQFAGMAPGDLRQSATVANPAQISENDMITATKQQLGLLLSPAERKRFDQQDEQIRQAWTGLADEKAYKAVMLAHNAAELGFRQRALDAETQAKLRGEKADPRLKMGSPKELMEQLIAMQKQTSGPSMTPAARAAMAQTQNAVANAYMFQMQEYMQPEALKEFMKVFAPSMVIKQNSNLPGIMR